jgi:hypothetical protein
LTQEALEERKWGPLPPLWKALADKSLLDDYYELSSISDKFSDRVSLEIATLANIDCPTRNSPVRWFRTDDSDLQTLEEGFQSCVRHAVTRFSLL